MKTKKSFLWLAFLILAKIWKLARRNQQTDFNTASGFIFGTVYKITYQCKDDLKPETEEELKRLAQYLSPLNDSSVICRLNERVMLFGCKTCHWLEPVSVVSTTVFKCPVLHCICNNFRNGYIKF